jgi:hypothetical protein
MRGDGLKVAGQFLTALLKWAVSRRAAKTGTVGTVREFALNRHPYLG